MKADILIDLLYGDNGKGKCVNELSKRKTIFGKPYYNKVIRFNGAGNAGHTTYHNGKKFITHLVPSGIFQGITSIIGPECMLNVDKFFEEINYLEDNGIETKSLVKVAKEAHIITKEHLEEDEKDVKIGTTKQGVGPCARDKYNRTGIRAESIYELSPYLVDIYEELFNDKNNSILFEGAQGFYLDISYGNYPYVTSSHCSVGSAIMNGVPYSYINSVYGIVKSYVTYVGGKQFQPEGQIYKEIQIVGKEFGATTGRKRQVNWLDIDMINKAIDINGVDTLIINKMDVLNEIGVWRLYKKGEYGRQLIYFDSEKEFKRFIKKNIRKGVKIIFSYSPERI